MVGARRKRVSGERLVWQELCSFAASLPEAYEDHPWGELVMKVNKKVFVFLGMGGEPAPAAPGSKLALAPEPPRPPGMCVKLSESLVAALGVAGAEPAGYGLGNHGWVNLSFGPDMPDLGVMSDWVEESYRLRAPKRLVAQLDPPPPD